MTEKHHYVLGMTSSTDILRHKVGDLTDEVKKLREEVAKLMKEIRSDRSR